MNRVSEFEEKKKRKMEQMKDSQVLEEYSFHPELVTSHDGSRRGLEKFLEDQDKFRNSVAEKVKGMKDLESSQTVSMTNPSVLKASTRMADAIEGRKGVDTKERLYNLNKEWQTKKTQKLTQEEQDRKTRAEATHNQSLRDRPREEPLVDSLYKDAEKRRNKLSEMQAENEKNRGLPKEEKYVNNKMDKYVISKFDKEFNEVSQEVQAMEIEEEEPAEGEENK